MRLQAIYATPHQNGNRIDLTWHNPDPTQFPGVRVVRRPGRHPVDPDDGVVVAEALGLTAATDQPLKGETVYYYALFPFAAALPRLYQRDRHNRAAAMATSPYGHAAQMARLLPAIYHRYDTMTTDQVAAVADAEKGQLLRFLDLPGAQLDLFYSFITALLDTHNLDKVDGRLLPLLAHWLGWSSDYRLEFDAQRNELRHAPALYQAIGLAPTVEATVKRVSAWESRTKEFVYNLLQTNQPDRLNLWLQIRNAAGLWSAATAPLSLDAAHSGRPTLVRSGDGYWLFYHTLHRRRSAPRWEIWYKRLHTFALPLDFGEELAQGVLSNELQGAFAAAGFPLSSQVTLTSGVAAWQVDDRETGMRFRLRQLPTQVQVDHWAPSQPLPLDQPSAPHLLHRRPTAAQQRDRLWLFWEIYDEAQQSWRIALRQRTGETWSPVTTLTQPGDDPHAPPLRKQPQVVVDNADPAGLWLFWLEKATPSERWQVRYNRHDGNDWVLNSPARFPAVDGDDPRVEEDLHLFFHPTARTLWLFWARRDAIDPSQQSRPPRAGVHPNQRRWRVLHRVKRSLDPAADDWEEEVVILPKPDPDSHDREAAAHLNAAGALELYWSSTRNGSWSIWQSTWAGDQWANPTLVTTTPYAQRDPLPFLVNDERWLIYHASDSLRHQSQLYTATTTVDARYVGATTVHVQDQTKLGQRGAYDDFQCYTYDAGLAGQRDNDDWYSRDTVGLYLTPDTNDPAQRARTLLRLDQVLREFMAATERAVYIMPA